MRVPRVIISLSTFILATTLSVRCCNFKSEFIQHLRGLEKSTSFLVDDLKSIIEAFTSRTFSTNVQFKHSSSNIGEESAYSMALNETVRQCQQNCLVDISSVILKEADVGMKGLSDFLAPIFYFGNIIPSLGKKMGWLPIIMAEQYLKRSLKENKNIDWSFRVEGGGGSGMGFQLYCDNNMVLTAGGGGGGGIEGWNTISGSTNHPSFNFGGGGGGGLQFLDNAYTMKSAPFSNQSWISMGGGGGCGTCNSDDELCLSSPSRILCGQKVDDESVSYAADILESKMNLFNVNIRSCGTVAVYGGGGGGGGTAECSEPFMIGYGFSFSLIETGRAALSDIHTNHETTGSKLSPIRAQNLDSIAGDNVPQMVHSYSAGEVVDSATGAVRSGSGSPGTRQGIRALRKAGAVLGAGVSTHGVSTTSAENYRSSDADPSAVKPEAGQVNGAGGADAQEGEGAGEAYRYTYDPVGALLHAAASTSACGGFGDWCCVCSTATRMLDSCLEKGGEAKDREDAGDDDKKYESRRAGEVSGDAEKGGRDRKSLGAGGKLNISIISTTISPTANLEQRAQSSMRGSSESSSFTSASPTVTIGSTDQSRGEEIFVKANSSKTNSNSNASTVDEEQAAICDNVLANVDRVTWLYHTQCCVSSTGSQSHHRRDRRGHNTTSTTHSQSYSRNQTKTRRDNNDNDGDDDAAAETDCEGIQDGETEAGSRPCHTRPHHYDDNEEEKEDAANDSYPWEQDDSYSLFRHQDEKDSTDTTTSSSFPPSAVPVERMSESGTFPRHLTSSFTADDVYGSYSSQSCSIPPSVAPQMNPTRISDLRASGDSFEDDTASKFPFTGDGSAAAEAPPPPSSSSWCVGTQRYNYLLACAKTGPIFSSSWGQRSAVSVTSLDRDTSPTAPPSALVDVSVTACNATASVGTDVLMWARYSPVAPSNNTCRRAADFSFNCSTVSSGAEGGDGDENLSVSSAVASEYPLALAVSQPVSTLLPGFLLALVCLATVQVIVHRLFYRTEKQTRRRVGINN